MRHPDTWGKASSPYHAGERRIHERFGIAEQQSEMTRSVYSQRLTEYHREFLAGLDLIVVGSIDDAGRPWASLLHGEPGFATGIDDGARQPTDSPPRRCASEKAEPINSVGVTIGTREPRNGGCGWTSEGGASRRRSPDGPCQRKEFRIEPPTIMR